MFKWRNWMSAKNEKKYYFARIKHSLKWPQEEEHEEDPIAVSHILDKHPLLWVSEAPKPYDDYYYGDVLFFTEIPEEIATHPKVEKMVGSTKEQFRSFLGWNAKCDGLTPEDKFFIDLDGYSEEED